MTTALAAAARDVGRVKLLGSTPVGAHLETVLRQYDALLSRYEDTGRLLDDVEELEAWWLCDQLLEKVDAHIAWLRSEPVARQIQSLTERRPSVGRRIEELRVRLVPRLERWRVGLLQRRSRVAYAFRREGLESLRRVIERELKEAPEDTDRLILLRERVAAANAGDPILLGDVADTAERVLRGALDEVTAGALREPISLTEGDLATARRYSTRTDGSISALNLATTIAGNFGDELSSDALPRRREGK